MHYARVVGDTLVAAVRDDFRPTLDDVYRSTARRTGLALTVITHGVAEMVREVHFATRDYTSLVEGVIAFFFVAHMVAEAEKSNPS